MNDVKALIAAVEDDLHDSKKPLDQAAKLAILAQLRALDPDTQGDSPQARMEVFRGVSAPLVNYLQKFATPHSYAVVHDGGAEMLGGQLSVTFPVPD